MRRAGRLPVPPARFPKMGRSRKGDEMSDDTHEPHAFPSGSSHTRFAQVEPLPVAKQDRFFRLQQRAYSAVAEAISEARKILADPNATQSSKKQARYFLDDIKIFVDPPKPAGDKADAAENRKMLDLLALLAHGKSLKDSVADALPDFNGGGDSKRSLVRGIRYASARLPKFCARVYEATRSKYPQWGDESLSRMPSSQVAAAVANWPGVNCLQDLPALEEAIRRYFKTNRKRTIEELAEMDLRRAAQRGTMRHS
jgi:hypothetical protein